MRLTHLKLAGFKSFVDATTLHIHGQRVGVVGPNGCGKSNVMESVRWVLGESSAKEMRGDSMDAVIFNGSGNRKAISRASVELIFDNSLGGAAGSWSQYAEISVKRVIERDKGSTYYINNSVVRRRDVADLFLGTGLGGRAYAIIGQNTINKIVEAKPEEMRIFLEEAAGISKYKERRKETELRLRDTRENLTRVEDILRELSKQITRLSSQALVTEQYHRLQAGLKLCQGQFWLVKKRDGGIQWEKSQRQVEKLVNDLEGQMASLRGSESLLETMRQAHFSAADVVNTAQGQYYEVNAEVSNLDQQVRTTTEARERVQLQLQQLAALIEKNLTQTVNLEQNLMQLQAEQLQLEAVSMKSQSLLMEAQLVLPAAESAFHQASAEFSKSQFSLTELEQNTRLNHASLQHLAQNINELKQRLLRYTQELANLSMPATNELNQKQLQLASLQADIVQQEQQASECLIIEQTHQQAMFKQRDVYSQVQRNLNLLEAEIATFNKIQLAAEQSLSGEAKLKDWLKQRHLENKARLWQKISVKTLWANALEAVLGSKLNALVDVDINNLNLSDQPPAALVLMINYANFAAHLNSSTSEIAAQLQPITSVLELVAPELSAELEHLLAGVYLLETHDDPQVLMKKLDKGESLVNVKGDIFTQQHIIFNAGSADKSNEGMLQGVLARKKQLLDLQLQLPGIQLAMNEAQLALQKTETKLQGVKQQQQVISANLKVSTQQAHQLNLELQHLKQQQQHAIDRQSALQRDIENTEQKLAELTQSQQDKQSLLTDSAMQTKELQSVKQKTELIKQQANNSLNAARLAVQQAEKSHQEYGFDLKLKNNNINELKNRLQVINEEKQSLKIRYTEAESTLNATKMETLKANLALALDTKQQRELALVTARSNLTECEQNLQAQERQRLQNEQQLHPLRDKLEQARLSEQQARLYFEQCQHELINNGLSEAVLTAGLAENTKANDLEHKTHRLQAEISDLGAVNLAAIQELATEHTRKDYLDSQSQDLIEASNTLESAISKIDKETRGRLQATFDEANRHFDTLFKTLFNGGQAKLELLGDEILDTGMQVFAQPPGKKNSTIHLLSGGEKALTALALVFALFKLNPAPFCLMDEVDAPLDDSNTERFCEMVKKMSEKTQFLFVSHNKITMEMAQQLIGVTMQESGVSRIVEVDVDAAMQMSS